MGRVDIPAALNRQQIEDYRGWVENTLNQLTDTAERWAANEIQLKAEEPLYRAPGSRGTVSTAQGVRLSGLVPNIKFESNHGGPGVR